MSSTDRQNRLLVAEDWKRVYQSYRNADFQSYDFDNLRRTTGATKAQMSRMFNQLNAY